MSPLFLGTSWRARCLAAAAAGLALLWGPATDGVVSAVAGDLPAEDPGLGDVPAGDPGAGDVLAGDAPAETAAPAPQRTADDAPVERAAGDAPAERAADDAPVDRAGAANPDAAAAGQRPPRRPGPARPGRTAELPPTHTVQPGDTLSAVARRYGVGPIALARANAVGNSTILRPGRTLVVPPREPHRLRTPEEAVAAGLAVEALFADAAARVGVDRALLEAVAWRESRWEQRVVSHRGAVGIMQVRPATGAAMARHLGRPLDLHDVRDNVVAGSAYLAHRLDRRGGDLPAALADYYQGPESVRRFGRFPATREYIADVAALRDRFARARAARAE